MVGLAAAALTLEALHVPALPHLRSMNAYVTPSLEAAAKQGSPQTRIAREHTCLSSSVHDGKLTAGISSFAFQVGVIPVHMQATASARVWDSIESQTWLVAPLDRLICTCSGNVQSYILCTK